MRGAGRLYGGADDPVRAIHGELAAAIRRVKSRLAPSSGTAHERKPSADEGSPATRKTIANRAYKSLLGTLSQAEQALREISRKHDTHRRVLGRGDGLKGMATFREESRELVETLNEARTRVRQRHAHYENIVDALRHDARAAYDAGAGNYPTLFALHRAHAERLFGLARRAGRFEAAADPLRSRLYRASRRKRPIPRRREPDARLTRDWRNGRAREAVLAFRDAHGRLPTKRECNSRTELPPYTTLQRDIGSNPLAQLDRLCNESHK